MPPDDAKPTADLMEVLWDRLGPQADASRRVEALRVLRGRRARRRGNPDELDPEVAELFGLIVVEPTDLETITAEVASYVRGAFNEGLARDTFPAVFQAYVRAIGRVVAAEATVARSSLAGTAPEDQARVLAKLLDGLLPLASRGFDVLHRVMLLEALADAVDEPDVHGDVMAVAMVDLVGSTRFLMANEGVQLERLVDALFTAGQSATARRSAHVVKYVGDGLFLAGRDVTEVADAALDVIGQLEAALPLRARGGLSWGTVVQHAGDLFGLPINVAHVTTKAAQPGTLVATAPAAAQLPAARRGRYRTARIAHPALGETRIATIHPA